MNKKLPYLCRGDDMLIDGKWYTIIGFSLLHSPDKPTTGSVFTVEPVEGVKHEPWLGYRIDYTRIEDVRKN